MERTSLRSLLVLSAVASGCGDDVVDLGGDGSSGGTSSGGQSQSTGDEPPDEPEGTTSTTAEPTTTGTPPDPTTGGEDTTGVASTGSTQGECGDGILDEGEACDDGPENGAGQACKADCSEAFCGDGEIGPDEECDDGPDNGPDSVCQDDCTMVECGDGVVGPGEECDDGDGVHWNECTNACRLPVCGDDLHSIGEECDNGDDNDDNGACLTSCVEATCGDGFVWAGVETCDDGNDDETDGCLSTCQDPVCGDGIHDEATEACDDGNDDETDGCISNCAAAVCGDGFVYDGVEECDDGNDDETDGCLSACVLPGCGNGVVEDGEECDDGNDIDGDACANDCTNNCPDGGVVYVDPSAVGAGTGASWDDAYTSLSAAMAAAAPGDDLWLVQGTYRPVAPNAPVVDLRSCIGIYGGFEGDEATVFDRPSPLPPTVFSGDVFANDDSDMYDDNARHVVTSVGVEGARLDGIVVTNGRATGLGTGAYGAGVYAVDSELFLQDCTLEENLATESGGGVFAESSDIQLIAATVRNNDARYGGGGAFEDTSVRVDYAFIDDNTATVDGGALWSNDTTDLALVEVAFASFNRNEALGSGGGAFLEGGDVIFVATDFDECTAGISGGAVVAQANQSASFNVLFMANNTASLHGGGLLLDDTSVTRLEGLTSRYNAAENGGGVAIFSTAFELPVTGEFTENTATDWGGGVYVNTSSVSFENSTFTRNDASGRGGGVRAVGGGYSVEFATSTFSANTAPTGGAIYSSSTLVTVLDSTLESNLANTGGAIWTSGALDLRGSLVTANEGTTSGGGVLLSSASTSVVRDTVFELNTAGNSGGAMHVSSTPIDILSSRFVGNTANSTGGALRLASDPRRVLDCTFIGNEAQLWGGAISASAAGASPLVIGSSSFGNNTAADIGGIYLTGDPSFADLHNLVLWGNGGDVGGPAGIPSPTIANVCSEFFLQPGGGNLVVGTDPFVPGPDGELFLQPVTSCVDAGDDSLASVDYGVVGLDWATLTTQMDGSTDMGTVDMGAHYPAD